MTVQRVIVTGANGAGKTHLARAIAERRPDLPLCHADALKLTTGWQRRDKAAMTADLQAWAERPAWIIEGGPSLLPIAAPLADVIIWLDPPLILRAWRLAKRPWPHIGRTRPELPAGNPDRLFAQYRFGWRSLRRDRAFRDAIDAALAGVDPRIVHRCRTKGALDAALAALDRP